MRIRDAHNSKFSRIISGWHEQKTDYSDLQTGSDRKPNLVEMFLYPIYLQPHSYCLNGGQHAGGKCKVVVVSPLGRPNTSCQTRGEMPWICIK